MKIKYEGETYEIERIVDPIQEAEHIGEYEYIQIQYKATERYKRLNAKDKKGKPVKYEDADLQDCPMDDHILFHKQNAYPVKVAMDLATCEPAPPRPLQQLIGLTILSGQPLSEIEVWTKKSQEEAKA